MALNGKVAIVTGASRGIGRGIAVRLGEAGATVYITGRSPRLSLGSEHEDLPTLQQVASEIDARGGKGVAVYVDHSNMDEVEKFFKKVELESNGQLDILVNNAFSAVNALTERHGKSFWECDANMWDEVNNVGLRNHYYCSVYAARLMVPRKSGLIVNVSSAGGLRYFINVPYGIGKCALDRMAGDMAEELRKHNVAVVSLWPGIVRTELTSKMLSSGKFDDVVDPTAMMLKKFFPKGESTEFSGKAVVALATDKNIMAKSGRILLAADVGIDYHFRDINDSQPASMRSLKALLDYGGFSGMAGYFPAWFRLPGWLLTAMCSRL